MVKETEVRSPYVDPHLRKLNDRYIRQKTKRSPNFVSCESLDTVESRTALRSSKLMLLDSRQAS